MINGLVILKKGHKIQHHKTHMATEISKKCVINHLLQFFRSELFSNINACEQAVRLFVDSISNVFTSAF